MRGIFLMFTLDVGHILICGRRTPPWGGAVEDGHGVDAGVTCNRDGDVVVHFSRCKNPF